jgi:hypothetical protein
MFLQFCVLVLLVSCAPVPGDEESKIPVRFTLTESEFKSQTRKGRRRQQRSGKSLFDKQRKKKKSPKPKPNILSLERLFTPPTRADSFSSSARGNSRGSDGISVASVFGEDDWYQSISEPHIDEWGPEKIIEGEIGEQSEQGGVSIVERLVKYVSNILVCVKECDCGDE